MDIPHQQEQHTKDVIERPAGRTNNDKAHRQAATTSMRNLVSDLEARGGVTVAT